jgi:hypothetical protein
MLPDQASCCYGASERMAITCSQALGKSGKWGPADGDHVPSDESTTNREPKEARVGLRYLDPRDMFGELR